MSNYKIFSNVDGLRDMTEAEKLNRNVRNDFAKGPYKKIIGREEDNTTNRIGRMDTFC